MISFAQWWVSFSKNWKTHSHYYILGTEYVLVEEVVSQILKHHPVSDLNLNKFVVGLSDDREIWETLFSSSIDGEPMVTIVRGAEKLSNMHLLPELIATKSPKHLVIFISGEKKIQKEKSEEGESHKWQLPARFENFEKKGRIIECSPFTQANAKTAVAWIKTKVESKDDALVYLLNETNGDMRIVRDALRKLSWLEEPATLRNVSVMLQNAPSEDFIDALVSTDKKEALRSLKSVDRSEYLQIIGQLDAKIDLAGRVHDLLKANKDIPAIMKIIGSQAFLVPAISKSAKHYSRDRRLHMRKLLAEADKRIRSGVTTGVMESLVVLW